MNTQNATKTAVKNLSMPRCAYGFRSGYAVAVVNDVRKRIHTSESAMSCPTDHELQIRLKFENGEGEAF